MVAALAAHAERPRLGAHLTVQERQMLRQIVQQRMAARLRLQRQGKGGIGVDVDPFHGIHLDGDG
jgi:hypothetical protein